MTNNKTKVLTMEERIEKFTPELLKFGLMDNMNDEWEHEMFPIYFSTKQDDDFIYDEEMAKKFKEIVDKELSKNAKHDQTSERKN